MNSAGWSAPRPATHFGRNLQSIHNDLERFEQLGIAGLTDGKAMGAAAKVTPEMDTFMHTRLAEDRVWNSSLLGEAVGQAFGVRSGRKAICVKLQELGYSWKRTRYAPAQRADPEVVAEHQASLKTLKRGHWTKS